MPDSSQPHPRTLDYETPPNPPWRRRTIFLSLGIVIVAVCIVLLAISVLTPHLDIDRDVAPRVKSAANLRSIGQAILLYSDDNHGQYPDSFQTILENTDITPDIFVSPTSNDTPANAPTTQATAAHMILGAGLDFVYLGAGLNAKTVAPATPIAYEALLNPADGANVLFADGHVEYIDATKLAGVLATNHPGLIPATLP